MSYRDLGNDDAAEIERLAQVVDAPDPRHPTQGHVPPSPVDSPAETHQSQPAMSAPRRRRGPQAVVLVALIASLGAYIGTRDDGPDPTTLGTPSTAATTTTETGRKAQTSATDTPAAPTSPPTSVTTPAPDFPAPDSPAAAGGAGPDANSAVPNAQAAADAFLPAWTLKGTPKQRRDALTRVTTARLVDALTDVDPANLPTVTGESLVDTATASAVVIDVPTSAGLAQLTVEPHENRWLVTAVSLKAPLPSATTTPARADSSTGSAAA